jgi:AraC-like DNA-binding protein
MLAAPAVVKALEQALTHAMITALSRMTAAERRWLPGQHARIVNRFHEFLESRPDEPVYLAELCSAIGASERILRTCCQEVLGVGPVRYLWLRRMYLSRRALLRSDASTTTVTEIATTHGFWELGRFSVEYRGLFGESPSISLRRPVQPIEKRNIWLEVGRFRFCIALARQRSILRGSGMRSSARRHERVRQQGFHRS